MPYTSLMCGIAGFSGEDKARIERMTKALVHRGPDGNAVFTGHGISLGHARLAILDPRPEGDQPMWNEAKTVVMVYNGEIMNYRELKAREHMTCKTTTDTEVLLQLYEKYGIAFVTQLIGMFAFILFDTKTNAWHLARDPSGIKPLYVSFPDGHLHAASEMRALMTALPKKTNINLASLSRYMRLQYVPGPETLCEGIESVPPGTILSWQGGKIKRTAFSTVVDHPIFRSPAECQERFPAIMDRAVADHLVSDRPVGIFLSGGMDSSIVLHHMSSHAHKPVKTFTVRFEATEEEGAKRFNADADLAAQTAAHYETDHHEVFLTAKLFHDFYADTARALDQPNADHVSVAQFLLAREAKKDVDVVLCGSGGDELFGGYPRYRVARILHALRFVPGPLRSLAGGIAGYPGDVLALQPGPDLAERLLARSGEEVQSFVRGTWFDAQATTRLFRQRFDHVRTTDRLRAFMEFDRHLWLVDESLRLMDGTTMGSGLEARVPFLDPRVIAASHGTKAQWHVSFTRTKALLKDTYRNVLPPHLFSLSKASFYPPLAKWLRRESAPLVERALEHRRIREYFETAGIRDLFERHKQRETYALHTLSTLIQLQHWFDAVYDA